jgi:hypothetical protein
MRCRPWTYKEINRMKELRMRNFTAALIAADLGRTPRAVRQQSCRHCVVRQVKNPERIRAAIRRLHPQGFSDCRIARRLGVSASAVRLHRTGLSLPPAPRPPEQRSQAARQARQTARLHEEDESVAQGWPAVLRAGRRVLEALYALGGSGTIAQVNALCGRRYRCRETWNELLGLGFIVAGPRQRRRGQRAGSTPRVFHLAPDVLARRQRRQCG